MSVHLPTASRDPLQMIYQPLQPILRCEGLRRYGLRLQEQRPCASLQASIHSFLQVTAAMPCPYPVIPDGTTALFFSPHCIMLGGTQTQLQDLYLPQAGDYFGVRFYPGRLRQFINLDLQELRDHFIPGTDLEKYGLLELYSSVYGADDFQTRVQLAEQWLYKRFQPQQAKGLDGALWLIYSTQGTIRIDPLASRVGCSNRHLNRIFHHYLGVSPKSFGQIIRVQQVCRQLFAKDKNQVALALDNGYFDQPHMLHDFRKHLHQSPHSFLAQFGSDFYKS